MWRARNRGQSLPALLGTIMVIAAVIVVSAVGVAANPGGADVAQDTPDQVSEVVKAFQQAGIHPADVAKVLETAGEEGQPAEVALERLIDEARSQGEINQQTASDLRARLQAMAQERAESGRSLAQDLREAALMRVEELQGGPEDKPGKPEGVGGGPPEGKGGPGGQGK